MPRTPPERPARPILADLPFCLARASLSFRRFNDQTLRSVGATNLAPGLASVLHAVDALGAATINDLVAQTHLPNGTLTGLLDVLERRCCLRRSPNPADGRSWLVRLTPKGRQLCRKLHVRHRKVMQVLGGALSPAEMRELTRLLEKVTACMRTYRAEETNVPPGPPRAATARRQGSSSRAASNRISSP